MKQAVSSPGFKFWFWDTVVRTTRTFVQGVLAAMSLDQFTSAVLTNTEMLYGGLFAGLFAVLTAFAAAGPSLSQAAKK